MKASSAILLALSALSIGFIAGRLGPGVRNDPPATAEVERLERERDEAIVRATRAEGALQAERRRRALPEDGAPQAQPGAAAPVAPDGTVVPAKGGSGDPPPLPDTPQAREAAVREFVAAIGPAIEHEDGERALELLRRIAAIVPEGREAAMDLAVKLNDDVAGAGALHLDQYTFYTSLGDTGVRDLMIWALANPSPERFRVLSAASIPWIVPKDRALEVLGKSLGTEKDAQAQQALVVSLAQMNDARAQKLLASVLADGSRPADLRAQVALSASSTTSPEMEKALEAAAGGDASDAVRAAARAALSARNPPQDGFLLTAVYPDGAAAAGGARAGDILLWYDGRATRELRDVRDAIDAPSSAETATVVVLRDGQETSLTVRRGRLGIQGRAVKRK